MGKGGSGGGTTTVQQSTSPWAPEQWFLREYMNLLSQLTTGETPKGSKFAGISTLQNPVPPQQLAGFNPNEQAGIDALMASSGMQGGLAGLGANEAANIIAGGNLGPNSNPYLQQYYQAAAQPMVNNYQTAIAPTEMSQAMLSGAFGGSADAESRALNQYNLGNNLGNLAANIYEPAYQAGLQQQTQTLGLSPSLTANLNTGGETALSAGGIQQQQAQAALNTAYQNAYQNAMWPYQVAGFFGGGLGGLGSLGGTTTGKSTAPGPSTSQDIFGGALTGLGLGSMFFPNLLPDIGSRISGGLSAILPFLGAA